MKSTTSNVSNTTPKAISSFRDFNVKELVYKYLKYWYLFVLSFIIFISIAYVSLRYSTPLYDVTSTIVISQEDNLSNAGLSAFKELGLEQPQDKIENEIQILKSKSLIKSVVDKLDLNIRYFYEGRILDIEEYNNPLIKLRFLDNEHVISEKSGAFNLIIDSNNSFTFVDNNQTKLTSHNFNTPIKTYLGNIIIIPNVEDLSTMAGKVVKINISSKRNIVDNYRARLKIMTMGLKSSVLQISLRDPIISRAENFINNLIDEYSKREIKNKNETARKTGEFIDDRLIEINQNLSSVENEAAKYMSKFGISGDLDGESNKLVEISAENNKEITKYETQNLLIKSTIDFIKAKESKNALIPSNLSFDDSNITSDIGKYNILVLKRNRLLKTSSTENPIIVKIDDELAGLKAVLLENLQRFQKQINIKLQSFKRKRTEINSLLANQPEIQKDLRGIAREQSVTEKLYLYLLEKKEEADITSHITVSNSRVIDRASPVSLLPVSPNKKGTYLFYIFISLVIPFTYVYVKNLLNTNITSRKDIENFTNAPIIGSIPKERSNKKIVITKSNNSPVSEAFRILRSNLDFLLRDKNNQKGKVIFVTSSISGEGKTFISSNIAKSIAILGKKVAYLGTDLRLPKFHEIFELPNGENTVGLTNFLINDNIKINDILYKDKNIDSEELFIIPAGLKPPNPTRLLINDSVKKLFDYLEDNFDYIVVDTAPISLVTDTLLISKFADLTIHVVKENFSDKRLLTIPEEYGQEGRLVNLSILLNHASSNMSGAYGYGYGYNTKQTKKGIFKFIK